MSAGTVPATWHPHVIDHPEHPSRTYAGVTRRDAIRVAEAVAGFLTADGGGLLAQSSCIGPFVCPPGFHTSGWSIAYEGDYDWPFRFAEAAFAARQPSLADLPTVADQVAELAARRIRTATGGLLLVPVSGWCLGVYQA